MPHAWVPASVACLHTRRTEQLRCPPPPPPQKHKRTEGRLSQVRPSTRGVAHVPGFTSPGSSLKFSSALTISSSRKTVKSIRVVLFFMPKCFLCASVDGIQRVERSEVFAGCLCCLSGLQVFSMHRQAVQQEQIAAAAASFAAGTTVPDPSSFSSSPSHCPFLPPPPPPMFLPVGPSCFQDLRRMRSRL